MVPDFMQKPIKTHSKKPSSVCAGKLKTNNKKITIKKKVQTLLIKTERSEIKDSKLEMKMKSVTLFWW